MVPVRLTRSTTCSPNLELAAVGDTRESMDIDQPSSSAPSPPARAGAVDSKELATMVTSLGMRVKAETLAGWIKVGRASRRQAHPPPHPTPSHPTPSSSVQEADTDLSGEIEFNEFLVIVSKAKKGQGSLASLISRKANAGPPINWREDKFGPGVSVIAEKKSGKEPSKWIKKGGGGWGVQLLDKWFAGGKVDEASVILQFHKLPGDVFIGVVGSNYNPGDWTDPFNQSMHAVGARSSDGAMFYKGRPAPMSKICQVVQGDQVQIEVSMAEPTAYFSVITPGAGGKDETVKADSVTVEHLHPEVTIAVAFGPAPDGQSFEVELVGSSSEKTGSTGNKTIKDLWDSDNKQGLDADAAAEEKKKAEAKMLG